VAVDDASKGISKIVADAIERLVNWPGLTKFVQAFPDPISALIGISVIFGTVLGTLIAITGLICSTIKAQIRAEAEVDLELARRGIFRPGKRSGRMWIFLLIVAVILLACATAILGTLIWSEQAKANYEQGVYYSGRFAEQAAIVLSERNRQPIKDDQELMLLSAATHLGEAKYARRIARLVRRGIPERYGEKVDNIVRDGPFLAAFREYLFAVSFFAHGEGRPLRDLALSDAHKLANAADLIFSQEPYPETKFWGWTRPRELVEGTILPSSVSPPPSR
jgi:hypothetical protein